MSADLAAATQQHEKQSADLAKIGLAVSLKLRELIARKRIVADVTFRVKDAQSLKRKLLTKHLNNNVDIAHYFEAMSDRLGLRITCRYAMDKKAIAESLHEVVVTHDVENCADRLAVHEMGYRGFHADCQAPSDLEIDVHPESLGIRFEVQVRSLFEHLWAEHFHDVGYKDTPDTTADVRRALYALGGLVEVADNHTDRIRSQFMTPDKITPNLLREALRLQSVFLKRTSKQDLPIILEIVTNALAQEDAAKFLDEFIAYVEANADLLNHVQKTYGPDPIYPLIGGPELPLLGFAIQRNRHALRKEWVKAIQESWLDDLEELLT